jgi:hypothetical protein
MSLKDQIQSDLSTFLNLDEFAESHDIDGRQVLAVVDSDILKIRSDRRSERYDGVYKGEVAVFVRAADLPSRPVYGQHMRLDGKLYLVAECTENCGMLEIVLEANES